jgi:hypothetical protein
MDELNEGGEAEFLRKVKLQEQQDELTVDLNEVQEFLRDLFVKKTMK